jgi:hypothetical protein
VARLKIISSGPSLVDSDVFESNKILSRIDKIIEAIKVKRTQYQYSLLSERPSKTAYFFKTALTASVKPITKLPLLTILTLILA